MDPDLDLGPHEAVSHPLQNSSFFEQFFLSRTAVLLKIGYQIPGINFMINDGLEVE